jgi:cobalt-zinc-cadmium efflux system protein
VVAALVNGLLMLVIVTGIVVEAVDRLQSPQPVIGGAVMLVAAMGLVINVTVAFTLSRGEDTLNLRGALLHVMGDLLGSIAALIAGAVIYFTAWTPIDPILSLFICLLILFSSLRLLRDALHVIMEGVPAHIDLQEVGRAMAGHDPRVRSVHDLHIWNLSSGVVALSAHVVIADMAHWQEILHGLSQLLRERFRIEHVTLQPETNTYVLQPLVEQKLP